MERAIKRELICEEERLGCFVTQSIIVCFSGEDPGEEQITLNVQKQKEQDLYYKIPKNMKLRFLMNDYCIRKGLVAARFTFDGDHLGENQTPQDLNMEDGDSIDVWTEQLGGGSNIR